MDFKKKRHLNIMHFRVYKELKATAASLFHFQKTTPILNTISCKILQKLHELCCLLLQNIEDYFIEYSQFENFYTGSNIIFHVTI